MSPVSYTHLTLPSDHAAIALIQRMALSFGITMSTISEDHMSMEASMFIRLIKISSFQSTKAIAPALSTIAMFSRIPS